MSGRHLKIALAQLNAHLGHVSQNLEKLRDARERAAQMGADIIATPEMFLSGYPADDLVLRSDFMDRIDFALKTLAHMTSDGGPAIIVGAPYRDGDLLRNALFVFDEGKEIARRDKVELPNYGVFDDKRHFTPGALPGPVNLRGVRIGLPICEDIWTQDVCETLTESGAEILLSINASPFEGHKADSRMMHAIARMTENQRPFIYLNLVGGQDELIFDGSSFAINLGGALAAQMPGFRESLTVIELKDQFGDFQITGQISKPVDVDEALYQALMLGIRDYVEKNGFPSVILGLSGGIDSALVAILAVDALGADRVRCVMMPSAYTADISKSDAAQLAENLGVQHDVVPIGEAMQLVESALAKDFAHTEPGIAEENIQSRLRGLMLMALSNKSGPMVLATGNKSEYAVGYATLYGDMCGGFAPIKDVWKTKVFELCQWRNRHLPRGAMGPEGEAIPPRIITRPPSAELRADQEDTDSLPPYDILDPILIALTEEMADVETIVARGYDRALVERASLLLFRAEYKRFQAAPGPKITPRAFGRDRRLPLTSGFRPDDEMLESLKKI